MRLADIVAQLGIRQAGLGEMLDPFQPARGQIRCRAQPRLRAQHLEGDIADLEREARLLVLPAADREDLAADLPDVGPAPLHHVGRSRQPPAEGVELLVGHDDRLLVAGPAGPGCGNARPRSTVTSRPLRNSMDDLCRTGSAKAPPKQAAPAALAPIRATSSSMRSATCGRAIAAGREVGERERWRPPPATALAREENVGCRRASRMQQSWPF